MSCVLSFLGESSKMWQLLATLSCLVVLTSARSRPNFPPLSDELVDYVNKQNTTWKVGCGGCCLRVSPLRVGLCTPTPSRGGCSCGPQDSLSWTADNLIESHSHSGPHLPPLCPLGCASVCACMCVAYI